MQRQFDKDAEWRRLSRTRAVSRWEPRPLRARRGGHVAAPADRASAARRFARPLRAQFAAMMRSQHRRLRQQQEGTARTGQGAWLADAVLVPCCGTRRRPVWFRPVRRGIASRGDARCHAVWCHGEHYRGSRQASDVVLDRTGRRCGEWGWARDRRDGQGDSRGVRPVRRAHPARVVRPLRHVRRTHALGIRHVVPRRVARCAPFAVCRFVHLRRPPGAPLCAAPCHMPARIYCRRLCRRRRHADAATPHKTWHLPRVVRSLQQSYPIAVRITCTGRLSEKRHRSSAHAFHLSNWVVVCVRKPVHF